VLDIGKRAQASELYPYPAALTTIALDAIDEGDDWMVDTAKERRSAAG